MGTSDSRFAVLDRFGESINAETRKHPIKTVFACQVLGRVFVLIGETHTAPTDYETHPFRDFLANECSNGTRHYDFFFEDEVARKYMYRDTNRGFETQENVDREVAELDFPVSLEVARIQGFRDCANFRNHAVDVRPAALLIAMGHFDQSSAPQEIVHQMAVHMLHAAAQETRRRCTRYTPGMPSTMALVAIALTKYIVDMCLDTTADDHPSRWHVLGSRLTDVYTFCRMGRSDNNKFCILYCGTQHARFLQRVLQLWMKHAFYSKTLLHWEHTSFTEDPDSAKRDMDMIAGIEKSIAAEQ